MSQACPRHVARGGARYDLDLARSWLVGDSQGDLGAGAAAGCRTILVRSGYGVGVEQSIERGEVGRPFAVVDALPQAVTTILAAEQQT